MGEIRVHDRNRSPRFIPPRDYVAGILETTADRFESGELNWHQGNFEVIENGQARNCAIGGLARTSGEDWNQANKPVITAAAEAMRPHISRQVQKHLCKEGSTIQFNMAIFPAENIVITFNDLLAQDVSEVVEAMKLAAKDLRNQS